MSQAASTKLSASDIGVTVRRGSRADGVDELRVSAEPEHGDVRIVRGLGDAPCGQLETGFL
eukprot:9182802-Lingulodinium_polyedra.AAC.1